MTKGTLEVLLVDAKGIKDREGLRGCLFCLNPCNAIKVCPYVVIQYGHQELTSSVADRERKKLVWNEKLSFGLEYPGVEAQMYKLKLQVMDKHKLSQHNLVGETVSLSHNILELKQM